MLTLLICLFAVCAIVVNGLRHKEAALVRAEAEPTPARVPVRAEAVTG